MGSSYPRIFDCFTFSTELDLLEFRLDLLAPVVDRFVIVEAPRTFSGIDKPLLFAENRDRYERHLGAITHVVVDDLPPPFPDRWVSDRFQRNAIRRGLQGIEPDDLVVVTDVDEIPDPAVLASLRAQPLEAVALEMRPCYYRANWELRRVWSHPRVVRASALGLPDQLRWAEHLPSVPAAGTHFSYLMGAGDVAQKYRWFAHDELDTDRDRSATYLETMQALAVLALTGDSLDINGIHDLNSVQSALLKRSPKFFCFDEPPRVLRRVAKQWRRARSRTSIPLSFISAGDAALAAMTRRARGGRTLGPNE